MTSITVTTPVVFTQAMRSEAPCRRHPTSLFFGDGPGPIRQAAKQICAKCPFTGIDGPCVQDAVNHIDAGIRGGLTHRARRALVAAGRLEAQRLCGECDAVFAVAGHRWRYCGEACASAAYDRQRAESNRRRDQHRMAS